MDKDIIVSHTETKTEERTFSFSFAVFNLTLGIMSQRSPGREYF